MVRSRVGSCMVRKPSSLHDASFEQKGGLLVGKLRYIVELEPLQKENHEILRVLYKYYSLRLPVL